MVRRKNLYLTRFLPISMKFIKTEKSIEKKKFFCIRLVLFFFFFFFFTLFHMVLFFCLSFFVFIYYSNLYFIFIQIAYFFFSKFLTEFGKLMVIGEREREGFLSLFLE